MIFAILLTAAYFIFLIVEKKRLDKARNSFLHVIHVNGIRGKTGTARYIDAFLRKAGFRVFTKTTGSTPMTIDVNGNQMPVKRRGASNILEQVWAMNMACKQGAQIVILECMAVDPQLQKYSQESILKADIVCITNVRKDHIFEMGRTTDEIAQALAGVIPNKGFLVTGDARYFDYFRKIAQAKGSEAFLCNKREGEDYENLAVAREAAHLAGASSEITEEMPDNYMEDFGAAALYGDNEFLNLFSVNDPLSTGQMLDKYFENKDNIIFLYNNRADRPDRLLLFAEDFFPGYEDPQILVMGESLPLAVKIIKKNGCTKVSACRDWKEAAAYAKKQGKCLVGTGNIKGPAYEMIQYYEER